MIRKNVSSIQLLSSGKYVLLFIILFLFPSLILAVGIKLLFFPSKPLERG